MPDQVGHDWGMRTAARTFAPSRETTNEAPLQTRRSGILLPRMDHRDDFDLRVGHAVYKNIIGMHDRFARAFHPAGTVEERMRRQAFGAGLDR